MRTLIRGLATATYILTTAAVVLVIIAAIALVSTGDDLATAGGILILAIVAMRVDQGLRERQAAR